MDGQETVDQNFPSMGTLRGAHEGSQSSVPTPYADPRMKSLKDLGGDRDSYRANTDSALRTIMDKSRYQHPDSLGAERGINARIK